MTPQNQFSSFIIAKFWIRNSAITEHLQQYTKAVDIRFACVSSMSKQTAAGMVHLENLKVLHRDLALRNILVGAGSEGFKYTVKISDFGMSRSVLNSSYYKSDKDVPIRWSAPEVLEYGTHTSKSDVYSFGVLLWEMFSYGKIPYAEFGNDKTRGLILAGHTLSQPTLCPNELYELMQQCWKKNPSERPTFEQIHTTISSMWNAVKPNIRSVSHLPPIVPQNTIIYVKHVPDQATYN